MNNSSTSVSVSTGLNDILALNKKSLQSLSANIPASSLLTIFGFVSATGNILTIITITMNKNLHTKCYFLMANLSVTDFLVGELKIALFLQ